MRTVLLRGVAHGPNECTPPPWRGTVCPTSRGRLITRKPTIIVGIVATGVHGGLCAIIAGATHVAAAQWGDADASVARCRSTENVLPCNCSVPCGPHMWVIGECNAHAHANPHAGPHRA